MRCLLRHIFLTRLTVFRDVCTVIAGSVSGRDAGELGMPFAVSEALLVRDILYVFQGIEGRYIK